jgi:2-polyprenyl-3-methyl-5-hydroxy-6-metoxy-1,4-benzoquinol methylase
MATPEAYDKSNGYEALAEAFVSGRVRSQIGVATVRAWGRSLPRGASILDVGCGPGVPISEALMADGFDVHGIDASPSMMAAFRKRFPHAPAACEAVEDSRFFDRTFDAVVSWGLMFLLPPETQAVLIAKAARALKPGGRFLFTAPWQVGEWNDLLTGRRSISLGYDAYKTLLEAEGLVRVGEDVDEGDNHYYFAATA